MSSKNLSGHQVAIISCYTSTPVVTEMWKMLREFQAEITAVTSNGRCPDGWQGCLSNSFEKADPEAFDSLIVMADKGGTEHLMDTGNVDSFIRSFFTRKRPVAAIGEAVLLLGQLDLLKDREVSVATPHRARAKSFGALITDKEMTTDQGLTTAAASVDSSKFILKVAEEIKEGRHSGQHA